MSAAALCPTIFSVFGRGLKVDREKRVIYGFAVATRGPALGHDENLDDTTLRQIVDLGNQAGSVRCRIDHPDQPSDDRVQIANKLEKLVGFARNFRIDGDVVRADCYVLPSDAAPLGDRLLALAASDAAEFFGASMVHASRTENKQVRVESLLALDFVDFPAANPSGLFSVGNGGSKMDPLNSYERDGKCYVMVEGKEYELAAPKKNDGDGDDQTKVENNEQDGEPTTGAMSAQAVKAATDKAREEGIKAERDYRVAFNAALSAGGIAGKEVEQFEKDFYGLDIKQVKFLAANAIAKRAKPVGEGGGDPDPKEKDKNDEKALEAACAKRFEMEPQLVKLWSRNPDPESEEYKTGFKRYVAREKQWAKDQKVQAQKAATVQTT